MAKKPMPGKLVVLLCLMGLSVVVNAVNHAWISTVIGVLLIAGVLIGNNGVRTLLRVLAVINIVFGVLATLAVFAVNPAIGLIVGIVGIGLPAYYFWVLGQDDVRDWMFNKNFHIDENQQL